jgi:Protein of unknown function (DUF3145)
MGTYTSYVVDIIGLPPEVSATVVHLLEEEYGLLCHTINPDASRPEWAAHGPDLVFENGDTDAGQAENIALALHQLAQTAIHPFAFEVVEEAAEDWPGSRYIYIPWLGLWAADAVGDSNYVATSKLQELLDGPPEDLRPKLEEAIGRPWHEALTELRNVSAN